MSRQVHDRAIHFRANTALINAAAEQARARGMSLAEMMRATLRTVVSSNRKGEAE